MRKRRAIIFDDDRIILKLLNDFLSYKGYEVICFAKPVVCPVYLHDGDRCPNTPCADIMLTDFKMPGMTGIELLKQQKEKGCRLDMRNKAIMSGFMNGAETHIPELGCAYFKKPFLLSELDAWIRECEERMPLSVPVGAQRKERREPVHIPVACFLPLRSEQFSGVVTNVSSSGFCLTTDQALSENDFLTLNADLPVSCCQAAVRWIRQLDNMSYMAGCFCC